MAANPLSCVGGYYTICEMEETDAAAKAGAFGDKLTAGLQELIKKHDLPFVAFNQGSICHLETVGTMHYSINWKKTMDDSNCFESNIQKKKRDGAYGGGIYRRRYHHPSW